MSATRDLIAAALTAADELDELHKEGRNPATFTPSVLREACARAMVQPAAPDMAEVEQLADVYADHVFSDGLLGRKVPSEHAATARTALLDYVRGVIAERDELIADNERLMQIAAQEASVAPQPVNPAAAQQPGWRLVPIDPTPEMGFAYLDAARGADPGCAHSFNYPGYRAMIAAAPQPVGEVDAVDGIPVQTGHAEADRLIGRLMSSDPDYDDCADAAALIQREIKGPDGFDTWREAALAERIKRTQQPVSTTEVPMPEPAAYLSDNGLWCNEPLSLRDEPAFFSGEMRTYGDAREAAVWAKVAKALGLEPGGSFAESYLLAQIAECAALEDDLLLAHQAGEAAGYARGLADRFDLAHELEGIQADVDRRHNFDATCRNTLARVIAALRGEVK